MVKRDLWEIGMKKAPAATPAPTKGGFATPPKTMGVGFGGGIVGGLVLLGLFAIIARRKK